MAELILSLLHAAPQIALGILFVIALAILLREYRSLRTDVKATVDDAVNAKLGALLGKLQIEADSASRALQEFKDKDEQIRKLTEQFEARLADHQKRLDDAGKRIQDLLGILGRQAEALLTPQDLIILADDAHSGDFETMLRSVLENPDATAADLTAAGNVARKRRKLHLALELYKRAVERDPEILEARLQHLCLQAEMDPKSRDAAIEEAAAIVLQSRSVDFETRLANTLIYLDRYTQLKDFCEKLLALDLPHDSPLRAQALRDLGVALREMGDFEKAQEYLEQALAADPDDENIVKAFLGILRARKDHQKLLEFARRLLLLDPLDAHYYTLMAKALTAVGRIDEAIQWHERAIGLMTEEGRKEVARREIRKLKARQELVEVLERELGPDHTVN